MVKRLMMGILGLVWLGPMAAAASPAGGLYLQQRLPVDAPQFIYAHFQYPCSVAVDPGGRVYVADTYYHRIQKFSADGVWLASWAGYKMRNGLPGQFY